MHKQTENYRDAKKVVQQMQAHLPSMSASFCVLSGLSNSPDDLLCHVLQHASSLPMETLSKRSESNRPTGTKAERLDKAARLITGVIQ